MPHARSYALSAANLALSYGQTTILDGIDITLEPGKVLALLGSSGSGKTTLLRLIAGLLLPDRGRIEIAGRPVADPARRIALPPEKRGLGMVFQDYALWPHLSVARNVAFPLEMQNVPRPEREERVRRALDRVALGAMADRRPSDLSGGQQQRVAIARAIVAEPPLVLFDEPLSNLDRELRETMVDEIATLVAELNLSAVYVTHDHAEALSLADQIAVMGAGQVEQLATPETLIDSPASAAVADFLRLGPLLPARRNATGWLLEGTDIHLPGPALNAIAAQVLLPERAMRLGGTGPGRLHARVIRCQPRTTGHALTLMLAGTNHLLRLTAPQRAHAGETVELSYSPNDLRWFPGAS